MQPTDLPDLMQLFYLLRFHLLCQLRKYEKACLKPLKTLAFTALLWYNISILNKGKFGVFMASNYHKSFIKDYLRLISL